MKPTVAQIIKKARRVLKQPGLDFLIAPAQDTKPLVIVVTPRTSGTAVERNTIRRRIKALIAAHVRLTQGYHCIFFIKKEGIHFSYAHLSSIILPALDAIPDQAS